MRYRNPCELPQAPRSLVYSLRLQILADFVETIAAENFTLGGWISPDKRRGCAVGLAAAHCGALTRDGLELSYCGLPRYRGALGLKAVEDFFGLRREDAERVFGFTGDRWASPRETAAEIRRLARRIAFEPEPIAAAVGA